MAWALLELASFTGEERFKTTAMDAIAYERSLFSPEAGNCPDLRDFVDTQRGGAANNGRDKQKFMMAWCHGAPGIGLALQTTMAQGFGRNHSLCHGDLGNLELLLQASEVLDTPYWRVQANRIAAMVIESFGRHGYLCGVPLGVEVPGLMTGLAGIGYELLRLAEPQRVPAVLVLAPPMLDGA
jgi:lantibiotic modifying enzyme